MTDRAKQLAILLRAIDDMHTEKAIFLSDWKNRMEVLQADLRKVREDVISGQSDLFVKGEFANGEKKAGVEVPPELGLAKSTGQGQ